MWVGLTGPEPHGGYDMEVLMIGSKNYHCSGKSADDHGSSGTGDRAPRDRDQDGSGEVRLTPKTHFAPDGPEPPRLVWG